MSMEKCNEEYIIKNIYWVEPSIALDCLNEIISEAEAKGQPADHTTYSARSIVLTTLKKYQLVLTDLSKLLNFLCLSNKLFRRHFDPSPLLMKVVGFYFSTGILLK